MDVFAQAGAVLKANGVRLMMLDGVTTIGLWSDLDGPMLRAALKVFHPDGLPPIRYVDGPGIPMRYKARQIKGQPVPLDVVAAMVAAGQEPWVVRDRMLSAIGWKLKVGVRS